MNLEKNLKKHLGNYPSKYKQKKVQPKLDFLDIPMRGHYSHRTKGFCVNGSTEEKSLWVSLFYIKL